jgi:hypothetical protein
VTEEQLPDLRRFPRLNSRILDPVKGRTVRLYKCQCGERLWSDTLVGRPLTKIGFEARRHCRDVVRIGRDPPC